MTAMPLDFLLILVTAGIAGIALLLHLLGHSAQPPLAEADAQAAWAEHDPDSPVRQLHLSADGMAALIETDRGVALVWRMGSDSIVHGLDTARAVRTARGLHIKLGNFAAPSVRVVLSADQAAVWQAKISHGTVPVPEPEARHA